MEQPVAPRRLRLFMYSMLSGMPMTNYLIRGAFPSLIPLIAESQGWSPGQVAILFSAFPTGYVVTQIPAGWAAQKFGGKSLLTANMMGNALCLFAIPRVVMRGLNGHWPLVWLLAAIGACQGPLMPGKAALQQAWLPKGVERVWATRFMSLGGRLAQLVAVAMTPRISSSLGWRYVCYIYGVVTASFAGVWHLMVTNAPPGGSIRGGRASPVPGEQSPQEHKQSKAVDWRIFRMPSVQAVIASHVAFNNSNVTLDTWSFVYFKTVFGIDEVTAGRMFSVPLALSSMLGNVVAGVGESVLQKRGIPLLRIRKAMSWAANAMQGCAVLLFGLSPTPMPALVGYFFLRLGQCFHGSGCNASYLEIGDKDSAMLTAVGNTLATVPQSVAPQLKLWIVHVTGSWVPLFGLASALQLAAGLMYGRHATLTPAREDLMALAEKRMSSSKESTSRATVPRQRDDEHSSTAPE